MNVIVVEYIDFMMEIVNCYDAPADILERDKTMSAYIKRINLIKNCLGRIDTDDFMKDCWFICSSYKFRKISNLFDGELQVM